MEMNDLKFLNHKEEEKNWNEIMCRMDGFKLEDGWKGMEDGDRWT